LDHKPLVTFRHNLCNWWYSKQTGTGMWWPNILGTKGFSCLRIYGDHRLLFCGFGVRMMSFSRGWRMCYLFIFIHCMYTLSHVYCWYEEYFVGHSN
jgi:hypothetical protein